MTKWQPLPTAFPVSQANEAPSPYSRKPHPRDTARRNRKIGEPGNPPSKSKHSRAKRLNATFDATRGYPGEGPRRGKGRPGEGPRPQARQAHSQAPNLKMKTCECDNCVISGHYHTLERTGKSGAGRRLDKGKKKPRPPEYSLCTIECAIDCKEPDHSHDVNQKVSVSRALEVEEKTTRDSIDDLFGDLDDLDSDSPEPEIAEEIPNKIDPQEKPIKPIQEPSPTSTFNTSRVPSLEEKKVSFAKVDETQFQIVPSHTRHHTHVKQAVLKTSPAALATLRNRFPNPYLSENFLNAALASLRKEHSNLDMQVCVETVRYFVSEIFAHQQSVRDTETVLAINDAAVNKNPDQRTFMQPSTLDYSEYVRKLGITVEHLSFVRLYGTTSTVPPDTTYNGNWEIVSNKGFITHISKDIPVGCFKTQHNKHPKLYRTQMCRISGETDFVFQDANGINMSLAMSRLTKAREGEEELRINQLSILAHLPSINDEILTQCSNSVTVIPDDPISLFPGPRQVATLARVKVAEHFAKPNWNKKYLSYLNSFATATFCFALYLTCALMARLNYCTLNLVCKCINYGFDTEWSTEEWTIASWVPVKVRLYFYWFNRHLGLNHADEVRLGDQNPEAKFKKELAKPGKHGRLYVSYNESILGMGWFFGYLKNFFCTTHKVQHPGCNLQLQVVKSLDENAPALPLDHEGLSGKIFSDDMTFRYKSGDVDFLFDADISSCDAGNSVGMFYILATLSYYLGATILMIGNSYHRLREAILIRNPSDPKEMIKIRPKTIFQGSGCPETTMVNNVASTSIAISMQVYIAYYNRHFFIHEGASYLFDTAPADVRESILSEAARAVGHVVTIEFRHHREEVQFLKYSPFETTEGEWVLVRNLGAILRSLGSIDGDITAKMINVKKSAFKSMSYEEKMEAFMANVVAGLVHEPRSLIMDALRKRFPPPAPNSSSIFHSLFHTTESRSHHEVPIKSFQARYGGDECEWYDLAHLISELRFGCHAPSSLLGAVMKTDYGLPL